MTTKRIYREDQYADSCTAKVTAVRCKDGKDVIACSESVFYPEGGGQPSDTGTVSLGGTLYEVLHASDESIESDVWHETDAAEGTFHEGDEVELAIDYDFRFRNMQRHLGEHMLSGTMDSLFGGINKGFHIGEDYVTIDIDLEGRMLTEDELDLAERTVNEAIWSDLAVTTEWFDTYEESLIRPVRKKVPHDGRVSVVSVGDLDDPYDCIACCGVHPSRSSEVGLLAIYKCESNKGMNRIYFDCGANAWDRLTGEAHMLRDIAAGYSCSPKDVPSRMSAEAEQTAALRSRLSDLADYVKEAEKSIIMKEIKASGACTYKYTSGVLGTDEMLKMGFDVIHEQEGLLLIMINPETSTCLLLSSDENRKCGDIVKEHAPKFGGKGGGRPDNARAMFSDMKELGSFVSEIEKESHNGSQTDNNN